MTAMGWRDEAPAVRQPDPATGPGKLEPKASCLAGNCTCVPTCETQSARVAEFLAKTRVPPKTLPIQIPTKVKGHVWLCVSCRAEQPGPGAHCGFRVVLAEAAELERDSTGRILKATLAQQPGLYRPLRIPEGWKPGDPYRKE
jgi:hypothetical protein